MGEQPGDTEEMIALLGWAPERFRCAASRFVEHDGEAEALRRRLMAKAGPGTTGRVLYNASGALCALLSAGRSITGEELARATELSPEELEEVNRFFEATEVAQVLPATDYPAREGDQPRA